MRKNKLFSRYQQSKKDRNLKNDNCCGPVSIPVFHEPLEGFRILRPSPYVTASWADTILNTQDISPEMWEEEEDE